MNGRFFNLKHALAILGALLSFNALAINSGGGSSSTTKMIVGDSIFALSGEIHEFLEDDLNESIDTYARSGCQMLGGNILCSSYYAIPRQYSRASKRGIETVIMNGGGNDFLLGDGADCGAPTSRACQEILLEIEETLAGMFDGMRSDGIDEIVFLGYYYLEDNDTNNEINQISMDYKKANYGAMGVKFVDTRAAFLGNERRYITSDGIHPTSEGSRVLANLIKQYLN